MKKLALLLLLIPLLTFSQITATVDENGKKVLLNNDGTWQYESQLQNNAFEGTGIWSIKYFVDEFGDPTDEGYIAHDLYIKGFFSNSATTNSNLNVYFLISGAGDVAVQLFEYAGRSPVKAFTTDNYSIIVKDSKGVKHSMAGKMYEGGNRIFFDPSFKKKHISKMHNIFLDGGEVSVVISKSEYGLSSYKFKVNADGYKNAFEQLFK